MAATLPVTNAGDPAGVDRAFASGQRSGRPSHRLRQITIRSRSRSALRIWAVWVWILPTALQAQVKLDGSLGAKCPVLPNAANQFRITPDLGHQAGANLFHSFEQFNLTKGQAAVFSGPSSIQNVLARVTGGASSIDGTLTSEIPGANLFLLNPKGILFGANATLNIDGAFHASTADYIALEDGKRFEIGLGDSTKLSAAPPAAFGFLGPGSGSISVSKAQLINPKGNLSLVGGDIEIAGDGKSGVARVVAQGNTVLLASMKSAGELVIAPGKVAKSAAGFSGQGEISIQAAAVVSATPANGTTGGQVMIRGGKLTVKNATIEKNSYEAGTGLGVDIETTGDLTLGRGAIVSAEGHHPDGKADGLRVAADNVSLEAGSHVYADNYNSGDGPDLAMSARTSLRADGEIQASNEKGSSGKGGRIGVTATSAELGEGGRIFLENRGRGEPPSLHMQAETLTLKPSSAIKAGTYGSRPGASLTLEVGDLAMLDGSRITADTMSTGPAGTITVNARGSVSLLQTSPPPPLDADSDTWIETRISAGADPYSFFGGIPDTTGSSAGRVSITARSLKVEGAGAKVATFTDSQGRPGGGISLHTDNLVLINGGMVVADGLSGRDAGRILVDGTRGGEPAESVVISGILDPDLGYTTRLSVTGGTPSGDRDDGISLRAKTLTLSGSGASISSSAQNIEARSMALRVGKLKVMDGATIDLRCEWSGQAGSLLVEGLVPGEFATEVAIEDTQGVSHERRGGLYTSATDDANPGVITVRAKDVRVSGRNNMWCDVTSYSGHTTEGHGGLIRVDADTMTVSDGGNLSSTTSGAGDGGMIQVHAKAIQIDGGHLAAETEGAGGRGGTITLEGDKVTVGSDAVLSSSTSGSGDGGAIIISARIIEVTGSTTKISSSARGKGAAGTVVLASEGDLTIVDGAQITVSSVDSAAGDVELTAGGSLRLVNGTISAEGKDGEISLSAADQVYLLNSKVTAASKSGEGGNIAIPRLRPPQGDLDVTPGVTPRFVILNHSHLVANAVGGNGGNVGIEAVTYVKSADSVINVSSTLVGQSGTEEVPTETFNFASASAEFRPVFVDQAARWQTAARPDQIDPGGYTLVGRRRFGNASTDDQRRIILHR